MAGFSDSVLCKKLEDLNASQQSIQTLSLWLIHHRKHYVNIVKTWIKEIQKADEGRCLTLMYLANDVIQNSKKKGPEYGKEFGSILKQAFEVMGQKKCSEKTLKSIHRLLNIWEERGVYDKKQIADFKNGLEPKEISQPRKKLKKSESNDDKKGIKGGREWIKSETEIEVAGMKELHVTLSPRTPPGDPPEPEDLIKALIDLENSASSDAVVREKIASLPPEVSEVNLLSKLEDKLAAEKLAVQVNEAVALLTEYNTRLVNEMDERKKVATLLRDFIVAQRELLDQAEHRLEEYRDKLQKVCQVRQEIKSHIQNLPDLTQLPDVTGGLAPLPSAGDLFKIH